MDLFDDDEFQKRSRLLQKKQIEDAHLSRGSRITYSRECFCSRKFISAVIFIFAAIFCSLIIIYFITRRSASEPDTLEISVTNEYPKIDSLDVYPWSYIVEPYRTTKINVKNSFEGASYFWFITSESDPSVNLFNDAIVQNSKATEISLNFTEAGTYYDLKVEEYNGRNRSISTRIICKYVRREIRDLTQKDREIFFSALKTFYTISLDAGRDQYGSNFFNYKELTRVHLQENSNGDTTCTPWHGGPTFITSHQAMVLWVEQALQIIEPSLSIPYWDYIQDSVEYGSDWSESDVFTDEYFGAYQDYPFKLSGAWSNLLQSTVNFGDDFQTRHNSYNIMTDWYNNDNSTSVHRSNKVCGLQFQEITLPDCEEIDAFLEVTTLTDARSMLEDGIHGRIHIMMGGVWDCGENYESILENEFDGDDNVRYILEILLANIGALYEYGYTERLYTNPGTCSSETPWLECRFTCSEINTATIDFMSDTEVYSYLDQYQFLKLQSENIVSLHSDGHYRFEVDDDDYDLSLKRHLLKLGCNPGRMSPFSTPLAATSDPIFLSTHSYYMRYWSYLQLTRPAVDLEWEDDLDCYGHREDDVLPWTKLFGESNSSYYYTHEDLLSNFDPTNPSLPYVHENFNWKYCK